MLHTIAESAAKRTLGNINAVVCMSHGDQRAHSISLARPACCTPQAQDWHLLAWSVDMYLVAPGVTPWKTVRQKYDCGAQRDARLMLWLPGMQYNSMPAL